MKPAQLLGLQGLAADDLARQRRVGHQAAPQHHALHLRKSAAKAAVVLGGKNITVVAHRQAAARQCLGKGIPAHGALVVIFPHAGMNGELRGGIAVIQCQQFGKFLGRFHAKACFQADSEGAFGKDLLQKSFQLLPARKRQKACAAPLGHHGAAGAAQIQIHLGVAQPGQRLAGQHKALGIVC